MKYSINGAICSLVAAATLFAAPASAAEFEWKLTHTWTEGRAETKQIQAFADVVNAKSEGRLVITPYPGGSLGIKQADSLRSLRQSSVEAAALYPGYLGRDAPDMAFALGNGVVFTEEEAVGIIPTLTDIYTDGYEKWDSKVVGWLFHPPWRLSVFCNEPINTLADLEDKKLRVWVSDLIETFDELSVPAQLIPQSELYIAMQTGVVDCAIYSVAIAKTISIQEVSDYAAPFFTLAGISAIAVSNSFWDSLPADLQQIVLDAGQQMLDESTSAALGTASGLEEAQTKAFAESGELTVLEPFPIEDRLKFYETAVKVWTRKTDELGGSVPGYRDQIAAALAALRN